VRSNQRLIKIKRRLTEWWRILKSSLIPLVIQTTRQANRCVCTDIALEDFAVVSKLLDDLLSPVFAQAKLFALTAFNTEKTQNFRVIGTLHAVHV